MHTRATDVVVDVVAGTVAATVDASALSLHVLVLLVYVQSIDCLHNLLESLAHTDEDAAASHVFVVLVYVQSAA